VRLLAQPPLGCLVLPVSSALLCRLPELTFMHGLALFRRADPGQCQVATSRPDRAIDRGANVGGSVEPAGAEVVLEGRGLR